MEKVLLTRPIFDSKQTENSLKKLNIKTLSCPLIEIKKYRNNRFPYQITT